MKRVISAILVIVITLTWGKFIESAQAKYSGGSGDPNTPTKSSSSQTC